MSLYIFDEDYSNSFVIVFAAKQKFRIHVYVRSHSASKFKGKDNENYLSTMLPE